MKAKHGPLTILLGGAGYDLVGGTPQQFAELARKETVKWADIIKRSGARID